MTPLAVSGPLLIGVVVIVALALLWVLMRGEADYVEEDPSAQHQQQLHEQQHQDQQQPPPAPAQPDREAE